MQCEDDHKGIIHRCEAILEENRKISSIASSLIIKPKPRPRSSSNIYIPATMDTDTGSTMEKSLSIYPIYSLPPGHLPAYRAAFLISNAALGTGLLNFPEAYKKVGGVEIAISVQLFLLIFIIGAFYIIALCANQTQASTYQDMILFMLGSKFHIVVQVLIVVYFFGSAITYVIVIGEEFSCIVRFASGHNTWYTNKTFLFTIFSLLLLLPLCLQKRLKVLSYTSFFGGVGALFITAITIVNSYNKKYRPDHKYAPEVGTDWKSTLAAIPVICFGFQCHISSVVVYSALKDRSPCKFLLCALVAMTLCTIVYALTGSYGYMTFGNSTKSDILKNYSENDTLVNVARGSLLFILLSSFSIVTFCARTVLDGFIIKYCTICNMQADETEPTRRIGILLCWFIFVLLLASLVNNIGVAITVVGGIASVFIFIFPGLCLFKSVDLNRSNLTCKDIMLIIISAIYLLLGMFIFGEVTTFAIFREIKARYIQ